MTDDEERRLIQEYSVAVAAYSATVTRLHKDRGYVSKGSYEALYGEAETARHHCEDARLRLAAYRDSKL